MFRKIFLLKIIRVDVDYNFKKKKKIYIFIIIIISIINDYYIKILIIDIGI